MTVMIDADIQNVKSVVDTFEGKAFIAASFEFMFKILDREKFRNDEDGTVENKYLRSKNKITEVSNSIINLDFSILFRALLFDRHRIKMSSITDDGNEIVAKYTLEFIGCRVRPTEKVVNQLIMSIKTAI